MSFLMKKSIGGVGRKLVHVLLDDSKTMSNGQVVMSYTQTDDVITHGVAALPILGIMIGIVDKYGNPSFSSDITAGTAASTTRLSVTTGSDNTTTKLYWGLVDTSNQTIYTATVSGTLGTTNESNKRGCKIDVDSTTSYTQLQETTATRTVGTPANFYSHGLDKDNSARLLVNIALNELDSVYE